VLNDTEGAFNENVGGKYSNYSLQIGNNIRSWVIIDGRNPLVIISYTTSTDRYMPVGNLSEKHDYRWILFIIDKYMPVDNLLFFSEHCIVQTSWSNTK